MNNVLFIGAGSDLARPLAHRYAKQGYGISLASRSVETLALEANDIRIRYGVTAAAYYLDVTDTDSHRAFYDALPVKPTGVICLAGILGDQKESEADFQKARKVIDTSYTGFVSLLHIIAEDFEARKSGFIVGVSSVAGERGRMSNYVYGSAKAAFTIFLAGLRNRLYPSHVHVMTVHPGFIRTKMIEGRETPAIITATPSQVARDIFRAQQAGKQFLYSKRRWRYIMLAFRMIPESVAMRLNLK